MQAKVMLLRSGSKFKLVCSDCRKTIAKNLPGEHSAYYHAGAAVQHAADCVGVKKDWVRLLLRIFATN
jgi:hypothetical protein